jgi:hypothetical protein
MPRTPDPLPPALQQSPFTVADARAAGVARSRLRAKDLRAPFHGVRASTTATDIDGRAREYAARMPRHELFSHTTAALLHGMRMPHAHVEVALHVGALRPHRAPRTTGVVGHQVPENCPATELRGLRVSDPIATWIQCGSLLPVDDLTVMADGLVRRKRPVCSIAELSAAVEAHAARRGGALLRSALSMVRSGTDSPRETTLRLLLVRAGLAEAEVNGPIRNEYGAIIAHGDLAYRREKVILEYDGGGHREEGQYFIDIRRLDEIMELGWRVIRVDKYLLAQPRVLLAKVSRALERAR